MAIGDDALGDGQTLVPGSALANTLDTLINQVKDDLATRTRNKMPVFTDGAVAARREPGSAHSVGFYTDGSSTLYFRPEPATPTFDYRLARYSEVTALVAELQARITELTARVAALEGNPS
jgi:hypothetical protein